MERYRVIDTLELENEHLLSDDVDRAVDDGRVYVLEGCDSDE